MLTLTPGSALILDTNILIYVTFPESRFHVLARSRLRELSDAQAVFWTSRQVMREFLAATTRPGAFEPTPSTIDICQTVRKFEDEFKIAIDDGEVTAYLLDLVESRTVKGKQIHDANIVATMRRYQIAMLLTHNTQDFVRYADHISVLAINDSFGRQPSEPLT